MKKFLTSLIVIEGLIGTADAAIYSADISDDTKSRAGDYYVADDSYGITQLKDFYQNTLNLSGGDLTDAVDGTLDFINDTILHSAAYTDARISAFGAEISGILAGLDGRLKDMDRELSGGVAAANALTGLDNHLDAGKNVSVGVGAGYYNSQTAVAFGGVVRTGGSHALNAGVSVGTHGRFGAKAGWNLQF
ncbi:MAG: YadA C-terminal domain-containing protein [Rickettsiales bacterium]|jgi:autotransporter adhesin|nr:YadA C-terminal domain-containing protein [Rickettsiales bacterium]